MHVCNCRIAPNVRGAQFSRTGVCKHFANICKHFADTFSRIKHSGRYICIYSIWSKKKSGGAKAHLVPTPMILMRTACHSNKPRTKIWLHTWGIVQLRKRERFDRKWAWLAKIRRRASAPNIFTPPPPL